MADSEEHPENLREALEQLGRSAGALATVRVPNRPMQWFDLDACKALTDEMTNFSAQAERTTLIKTARSIRARLVIPELPDEALDSDQKDAHIAALMADRRLSTVIDLAIEHRYPMPDDLMADRNKDAKDIKDITARLDAMALKLDTIEQLGQPSLDKVTVEIGPVGVPVGLMRKQMQAAREELDHSAKLNASLLALLFDQLADEALAVWAAARTATKGIPRRARNAFKALADQAGKAAKSATTLLAKIRKRQSRAPGEQAAADPTVPPPDEATREQWELEAAVAVLTGAPIPAARQPHLRDVSLSAWDDDLFGALKAAKAPLADIFEDPKARQYSRRLKLFDLSQLLGLANLRELRCDGTQVSDLSPLRGLANLKRLHCSLTQVSDLSPLQGLANLRTLDCGITRVADLSPLQGLANLQTLFCSSTRVSDLSPLQDLANLRTLDCRGTQVTDWSPVDHVDTVYGRPDDWPRKGKR